MESPAIGVYPLGSSLEVKLLAGPLKVTHTLVRFRRVKVFDFLQGKRAYSSTSYSNPDMPDRFITELTPSLIDSKASRFSYSLKERRA